MDKAFFIGLVTLMECVMRNFIFLLLFFFSFLSADSRAMDLLGIYRLALSNDAQFGGDQAALSAGREKIVQGRAGLLPTLSVSGGYSKTSLDNPNALLPAHLSVTGYTLSLAQPLFRPALWEQYEIGKLTTFASEIQFLQAKQDLIMRVIQAYFEVLAAEDVLASIQAQKLAIIEQLTSAKRNYDIGTATITDTREAQARYDLIIAQELLAQSDLETRQGTIQVLTGMEPAALSPLNPETVIHAPEISQIKTWVETASSQNYRVLLQQINFEIAHREVKKSRAGHYPNIDLVASRNHSNPGNTLLTSTGSLANATTVGIQVTIPFFSGFSVQSKESEAIALEEKARNDLMLARRTAEQSARQAYLSVVSGSSQITALESAELSSKSALDATILGYQVGNRINIDILNAQQQLYSIRKDLAKARYDMLINRLRLKSTTGTLSDSDLVQINSMLRH
jgi:outer membrane protein